MPNNFNIHLGSMPPIAWVIIIDLAAIIVGKLTNIALLFNVGIWSFIIIVIVILIAFLKEVFNV